MRTRETAERPLLDAAEERDREVYARCRTVERALEAIGFGVDDGAGRVARLIARLTNVGDEVLEWSVAEIAADKQVQLSDSYTRRVLRELEEFQVIVREEAAVEKTRRRGRPCAKLRLRIDWESVRGVLRQESSVDELRTADGRDADETRTSDGRNADETRTERGRGAGSDNILTQTQKPVAVPGVTRDSDWAAAAAELDGFVRMTGRVITEAQVAGLNASQLVDLVRQTKAAAYGGGAVLAAIRSGDWVDLVAKRHSEPAGRLQHGDAKLAAENVRIRAVKQARERFGPAIDDTDGRVRAVIAKRLAAAGLADEMTTEERSVWRSLLASPTA